MMSNPLESLKKTKKVPLNGAERLTKAPYRRKAFNVLDVLPGGETRKSDNATKGAAPTDMELLSSMAGRLALTEQQLRHCTKEVIEKDKKISILEEKVKLLEKARGYSSETVQDLERRCRFLQEQVVEMEQFLADYGMIWVGADDIASHELEHDKSGLEPVSNDTRPPGDNDTLWNPEYSLPSKPFKMNFNLVAKHIEELNMLCAGSGGPVVSQTKAGATFKTRESVPLTLFANGILMFSGPFRPYSDETTQRCMQDFMDGYFPSELESRYPDGVPFKVTDKREVVYKNKRTELLFPGAGQPLDSNETELLTCSETTSRVHSLADMDATSDRKVSVERFLNNLPPSVIRNGKIIDVRSGIADTLKGPTGNTDQNNVTVIDTPVINEIKSRTKSGGGRPLSTHRVTTLRIKSENGDQTYILKLEFTNTIGDVRQYINKMRPELRDNYSIKTSFPNKVHEDIHATLEEAQLVPNATLHILLRK